MLQRRRTVQHLWNRFMAAMLFVVGAALGTAAPSETEETRLSRAETGQFETGSRVKPQRAQSLDARFDGVATSGMDDQPLQTPAILRLPDRRAVTFRPSPHPPARRDRDPARGGDARAPPSA